MFLTQLPKLCFILFAIILFSCNHIGYSKASCDEMYFHDDNKQNDTNKIIVLGRVVFDTTANELRGIIIDSLTSKPISGAKVYIWNNEKNYLGSTDNQGSFQFLKNNFSGLWQLSIYDSEHKCLTVRNINIGGGLRLKIKLHSWLTK